MRVLRGFCEQHSGQILRELQGEGAFHGERAELRDGIGKRGIVHDDEFFQRLQGALANRGVRAQQQPLGQCVGGDFREDVALRIE